MDNKDIYFIIKDGRVDSYLFSDSDSFPYVYCDFLSDHGIILDYDNPEVKYPYSWICFLTYNRLCNSGLRHIFSYADDIDSIMRELLDSNEIYDLLEG